MMKRILYILGLSLLLAACNKESVGPEAMESSPPDQNVPAHSQAAAPLTAIVTVKQASSGGIYFQLNEDECLYPLNYEDPYTGLRRIICGLEILEDKRCNVLWLDEILEGEVLSQGDGEAPDDGLTLLEDWMTSVEDGYLTLHYSTLWGDGSVPHRLALYTGIDPADPYQLRLVHSRNGDEALEEADALICFDINTLPSTGDGYQTLTLNWTTSEGTAASKTFPFRTRP